MGEVTILWWVEEVPCHISQPYRPFWEPYGLLLTVNNPKDSLPLLRVAVNQQAHYAIGSRPYVGCNEGRAISMAKASKAQTF